MTATVPYTKITNLKNDMLWIEGSLGDAPEITAQLVIGPGWLIEVVQSEESQTSGLFWAPFSIIQTDTPALVGRLKGDFVGFSRPGKPPAEWLTESMIFDLEPRPLPRTYEELIAVVCEPRPYTSVGTASGASPLSEKAKARIAQTYRDGGSIAGIASGLGVSQAHLTRQFKRDFGLTPLKYRNHLRVNEAVRRLSVGEKILDVGYAVGFKDAGRFYQDFRKVTGTSPGKCRP
jgi:AraC-like DNA-binding protein